MHCTNCGKEIPADTTKKGDSPRLKWALGSLAVLLLVVLLSNVGGVDQKKYDVVSKHRDELVQKLTNITGQNEELLAELKDLRQTDQGLWREASRQSGLKQWAKSKKAVDQLIANWPKSPLIPKAAKLRAEVRKNLDRQRTRTAAKSRELQRRLAASEARENLAGLKWYEGGTLHGKTVAEWRAASSRDRLATSSDFVAKIRKFDSLADMLVAAHGMQTCITTASPDEGVQHLKVSEMAASCAILLGYR